MAVNISAPQISHPSTGLRASIGSGVIYEGLETMPLSDEDRWNTGAGWTYETGPCPELQISSSGNCVNTRPFAPGTPKVYSGRALNVSSQIMCSTWGVDIRGKDGKIDIEGIVDEEIEIIKSIPNFDFSIPVLGNGNISNGNITISIPFINKGIMFNQSDLETFRQLLTK